MGPERCDCLLVAILTTLHWNLRVPLKIVVQSKFQWRYTLLRSATVNRG
jgi:hypothetical protein